MYFLLVLDARQLLVFVGFCWLLAAARGAGLFFYALPFFGGVLAFSVCSCSFWLSMLGNCSHFLSILNGDFCVICSLILL